VTPPRFKACPDDVDSTPHLRTALCQKLCPNSICFAPLELLFERKQVHQIIVNVRIRRKNDGALESHEAPLAQLRAGVNIARHKPGESRRSASRQLVQSPGMRAPVCGPQLPCRCAILCLERALESGMDSMNGQHGKQASRAIRRDSQTGMLSVLHPNG